MQSVGASVEFGNLQGAVINVITRQGGARFQYDASYYGQTSGLTAQPVLLPVDPARPDERTGYERARYRDFTTNVGGPLIRDRIWFLAGYQYLRDYDSQPGTDPDYPRTCEQDKVFGKLTWRLSSGLQLLQSFHGEFWVNPDTPTRATPFEATRRRTASRFPPVGNGGGDPSGGTGVVTGGGSISGANSCCRRIPRRNRSIGPTQGWDRARSNARSPATTPSAA